MYTLIEISAFITAARISV